MGGPELAPAPPGLVTVLIEGGVAVLRLNRPEALNALSRPLMTELVAALDALERDAGVRCVLLAGSDKAFAAGADIREMDSAAVIDPVRDEHLARWDRVGSFPKPIVAAVSGFALGGGLELVMACDIVVASETAVFGQPEILIGVIPGAGGTQRLTRVVGKHVAMEMVLTGRRLNAREALAAGLVNRVFPIESYFAEAMRLARETALLSPAALAAGKAAVRKSLDADLAAGLDFERRLFNSLFSTEDQKEGMRAFIEKRKPKFQGK